MDVTAPQLAGLDKTRITLPSQFGLGAYHRAPKKGSWMPASVLSWIQWVCKRGLRIYWGVVATQPRITFSRAHLHLFINSKFAKRSCSNIFKNFITYLTIFLFFFSLYFISAYWHGGFYWTYISEVSASILVQRLYVPRLGFMEPPLSSLKTMDIVAHESNHY
jgi:hypothetical protein